MELRSPSLLVGSDGSGIVHSDTTQPLARGVSGQGANFGLDIARGVGALLLELERQGDAAGKRSLVVFGNLIRWIVVLWNCAYGHINSLSQKLPPRLEKAVTWDSQ